MTRQHSRSASRGLVAGLDVMTATLVAIALVQAPAATRAPAIGVAVVLAAVYVWGRATIRVHERPVDGPRGRWWPETAYVAALLCSWIALLWLAPAALWLAFPLMLLQMHVLGPLLGVIAVGLTTAIAIVDGLLVHAGPEDPATAFVIGPVLGGIVAAGVVLGIEVFVRESQERQRMLDELTTTRRHLDQAERERAVTDERARLAREIHDTIAQSLSAIDLLLRAAGDAVGVDDHRARDLVERARGAARDSLDDARRVVHDLTPGELDSATLLNALQRVADRISGTHNDSSPGRRRPLEISVEARGEPRRLPIIVETALLRIVQSALANVSEHAGAGHAQVTVAYEVDTVAVEISDDGVGFDASRVESRGHPRGYGIPAIRARSDELGGTCTVETGHGHGTTLTVTLPSAATEAVA